jgi:hypothetical protein
VNVKLGPSSGSTVIRATASLAATAGKISAIEGQEGYRNLEEGDRVEFAVEQGQKGPAAVDVRRVQGVA